MVRMCAEERGWYACAKEVCKDGGMDNMGAKKLSDGTKRKTSAKDGCRVGAAARSVIHI